MKISKIISFDPVNLEGEVIISTSMCQILAFVSFPLKKPQINMCIDNLSIFMPYDIEYLANIIDNKIYKTDDSYFSYEIVGDVRFSPSRIEVKDLTFLFEEADGFSYEGKVRFRCKRIDVNL